MKLTMRRKVIGRYAIVPNWDDYWDRILFFTVFDIDGGLETHKSFYLECDAIGWALVQQKELEMNKAPKQANEIYDDLYERFSEFYAPYDYGPILRSFGEILLQVDSDDYDGDSLVLYGPKETPSILKFGWGSCSGCDALQACQSENSLNDLIQELYDSIRRFASPEELLSTLLLMKYNDTFFDDELVERFIKGVVNIFKT